MLARFCPSPAMVVALTALVVALGGTAFAVTNFVGPDGQIRACVSTKGKLILVKPRAKCKKGLTAISWSQKGPRGKPGLSNGSAGGDLSGHYPNPRISASLKDGASDTPSLRSLGTGALQAMPGDAAPSPGGAAGGDLTGNYPNPSIRTAAVNSSNVAANSLTGADILESSLGKVPSASSADSASAVNGQHAASFSFSVDCGSNLYQWAYSPTTILTLNGLTLTAQCKTGNEAQVHASTDTDHSYVRTSIGTGALDPDWNKSEDPKLLLDASANSGDSLIAYRRGTGGAVTTVTFSWAIGATAGAPDQIMGTAIGGPPQ